MSQTDILNILNKSTIPLNRGQIADRSKMSPSLVSHTLTRLMKAKDISCIEVDRNQAARLLNSKSPLRRMRFYYIEGNLTGESVM